MNETIGNRITRYRRSKGLTQEELAAGLGISSQAVSKWENDASCPDISLLPMLAEILGITTDELLTGRSTTVRLAPEEQRRPLEELTLRIRIIEKDGDKIRVNLPMALVKLGLELGVEIAPKYTRNLDSLERIDLNKIMELAEQGMLGKLVEIEEENGDIIEVVVE